MIFCIDAINYIKKYITILTCFITNKYKTKVRDIYKRKVLIKKKKKREREREKLDSTCETHLATIIVQKDADLSIRICRPLLFCQL